VENFHAFQSTLQFIVDDLQTVFDEGDKYKDSVASLQKTTEEIERECVLPLQAQLNGPSVVGKLQEYLASFDQVKPIKKLRDGKLLEYDYHRDNVGNLSEKTQKDPTKLPKAKEKLNEAKTDYETCNEEAKRIMIQIIDAKIDYDPIYLIFVSQLATYTRQVSELLGEIAKDAKGSTGMPSKVQSFTKKGMVQTPVPEPLDSFLEKDMENLSMKPIELKKKAPPKPTSQSSTKLDPVPPKLNIEWFYLDKALAQKGPITAQEMKAMFKKGDMTSDQYIFGGEMTDWIKISMVGDLSAWLKK